MLEAFNFVHRRRGAEVPFTIREIDHLDGTPADLFRRSFHCAVPTEPRHFIATTDSGRTGQSNVAGYIHFTPFEDGVYLCGGLCVDQRVYRGLSREVRETLAQQGSLSRWLIKSSIAALGTKRAVFAYTGDARSRRDALALGFVPTVRPLVLVQWHGEPEATRAALIEKVAACGPF